MFGLLKVALLTLALTPISNNSFPHETDSLKGDNESVSFHVDNKKYASSPSTDTNGYIGIDTAYFEDKMLSFKQDYNLSTNDFIFAYKGVFTYQYLVGSIFNYLMVYKSGTELCIYAYSDDDYEDTIVLVGNQYRGENTWIQVTQPLSPMDTGELGSLIAYSGVNVPFDITDNPEDFYSFPITVFNSIVNNGLTSVSIPLSQILYNQPFNMSQPYEDRDWYYNERITTNVSRQSEELYYINLVVDSLAYVQGIDKMIQTITMVYKCGLGYKYISNWDDTNNNYITFNMTNKDLFFYGLKVTYTNGNDIYLVQNNIDSNNWVWNALRYVNNFNGNIMFFTSDFTSVQNQLYSIGLAVSGYTQPLVIYEVGNIGYYLQDVFDMINITMGGFTSLFGVMVLPGLALGTMLMIPFVVTIIMFVIKLFKR